MTRPPNRYSATPEKEERQMQTRHLRPGRTPALMALLLSAALTLAAAPFSAHAATAPPAIQATCTVPNVIGKQVNAAALIVAFAGFSNIEVESDDPAHDVVVSVSPAAGSRVNCTTTVYIEGEYCRVTVPYVTWGSVQGAINLIQDWHLVPKVNGQGKWVLSQSPQAGTPVNCYTNVYLTTGPPGTDPP